MIAKKPSFFLYKIDNEQKKSIVVCTTDTLRNVYILNFKLFSDLDFVHTCFFFLSMTL